MSSAISSAVQAGRGSLPSLCVPRISSTALTSMVALPVLQRGQPQRPKLNWADRALLATLLGVIPRARRQGLTRFILVARPRRILEAVFDQAGHVGMSSSAC